tara:strand:- start:1722 stop:2354 length:633 start_codon:yes stop_codon:yes gene_type:complete
MKTRKMIEEKLATVGSKGDWFDALRWVLQTPDCPMCEAPNRHELEMKLYRGETTASFLEQKYGWLPGSVNVHLNDHEDFDPLKAGLIEAMRQDTINTVNLAENMAQRLSTWIDELEAQRSEEWIDSDFIADATRLTAQLGGYLKLAGQLKKEIGVDNQLLLAQRQLDEVMYVLVDTLKQHPELLDQIELRVSTLKAPVMEAKYTVEDLDD